jgi:hypothetical protein
VAFGAMVLVLVVLVTQLLGIEQVDEHADSTSLFLLILGVVLAFVWLAPDAVKEGIERVSFLKLPGGVEVQLQVASRAERVDSWLPEEGDEVTTKPRPRGGGAASEYDTVRDKLEERLRSLAKDLFSLPRNGEYRRVIGKMEEKALLDAVELHLVRDLLGAVEDDVEKMPAELRKEYLDASWRFAMRFRTLVFERLARREMATAGWFIVDFEQARSHRPDFLAYRGDCWLLIAARFVPNDTEDTRKRLQGMHPPFGATAIVVAPDSRPFEPEADDTYTAVPVLPLTTALEYRP